MPKTKTAKGNKKRGKILRLTQRITTKVGLADGSKTLGSKDINCPKDCTSLTIHTRSNVKAKPALLGVIIRGEKFSQ